MEPFHFNTRLTLVELLGKKAKNLYELVNGLKEVPEASIYHHTHRFLQQHHYLSPEPPNDFSFWTVKALGFEELGERLASVDTIKFGKIAELREALIEIIESYLEKTSAINNCQEGQEFHFMSSKIFIFTIPYSAHDLREFIQILDKVSVNSIYFHMFEARLRLEQGENDFSNWLEAIGYKELARDISKLDPYCITLEGLRKQIIQLASRYVAD